MTMEYVRVRVLNDYGVKFPMRAYTEQDGPFFDESLVSPSVRGRLLGWAREFNERFDPSNGWPTEAQRDAHIRAGRELWLAVRAELPPEVTVEADIWEIAVQEQAA